jgi:hypothetical protein
MPICGARTNKGPKCQNTVAGAGQRCHLHVDRSEGQSLFKKVMRVCGYVADIAGAVGGLSWIYQNAEPYIQPLLNSGSFSPERFWFDGLELTKGQSAKVVVSALKKAIKDVQTRETEAVTRLTNYSDKQRQQISAAYDAILANIQRDYPKFLKE